MHQPRWESVRAFFPLFLVITSLAWPKDNLPDKKKFDNYFLKEKEILIQTTGLDVSYFWQFLVDKKANILALDPKGCQLLVFDEKGRFLRRIGRQGQGPGEFGLPMTMCLDPAGHIHVADSHMRRINTFTDDGKFQKSFIFSAHHTQALSLRVDSAGNRFLAAVTIPTKPNSRSNWLVKYDTQGRYSGSFYEDQSGRGWTFRMDPPFTFDVHAGVLYAMQIDRYQMDLFDSDGRWVKALCTPPKYFVPPDRTYVLEEQKYSSQKELYNELMRLMKSWTRILRLDVINDRTILVVSAANGLVKDCQQPYILDLWTIDGELIASGIPSEYKFLCSDKMGDAYFLIRSDEETALEKAPTYIIGKFKLILPGK